MPTRQELLDNLIFDCAEKIEYEEVAYNSNNKVRCPMIFMYLGEKSISNYKLVQKVIYKNWRMSSRYIFHLGVQCVEGTIKINNLLGDEENAALFEDVQDDTAILNELIYKAKAVPIGTYSETDNNNVKLNFILSADDTYAKEYIQFAESLRTSLDNCIILKDLFLMITQMGSEAERRGSVDTIRFLYEEGQQSFLKKFEQIFVLSNCMRKNDVLDRFAERESYRIIADTILLVDNVDGELETRRTLFYSNDSKMRTIAHRAAKKPCREIVIVVLKSLLQNVLDITKQDKNALIQSFEKDKFEEKYFENTFNSSFPQAEDFMFLPFDKQKLKQLMAEYNNGKKRVKYKVNENGLNTGTQDGYQAFWDLNYKETVKQTLDKQDVERQLIEHCIDEYSYRDIMEYFTYDEFIDVACKNTDTHVSGKEYLQSYYHVLERFSFLKARNEYLEEIRPIYRDVMTKLCKRAREFEDLLVEMQNDISCAFVIENEGLYQSIDEFYTKQVNDYFYAHKKEISDQICMRIETYEELINALQKIFNKLLRSETLEVYNCSFLKELEQRLGRTPEVNQKRIEDAIVPDIERYTRLRMADDNLREMYDAYLCDIASKYIQTIDKKSCFDTGDQNYFEHLKIYSFKNIRDILGSKMEEK